MKVSSSIAAAFGLALGTVAGAGLVQAAVVAEPTITIGSMTPTPESPAIARKEAAAVLAQARQDCPKETGHEAQRSCMTDARNDYHQMMAKAGRAA